MQNIVIINPDQMRWDYMTPNGHPFIETRHLSRLAAMGTNFSHAYTSCPMCGPARTSFVTGQYPSEHTVRNYVGSMHPKYPTYFDVLRNAGYRLALYGKDHIITPNAIGMLYDEGEDICIGNMDDHPDYERSWNSGVLDKDSQWNLTERLTTAGIDFIERQSKTDQPFFVTMNYQDPHPYFTCPEPYASMFSPDQFELPSNFRRETNDLEPRRMNVYRHHSRSLEATEEDFKKAMAMYAGQVRYVDDQVGRVLDKLEELDLLDNTIVVFWSDHGEFVGDFGVTHKLAAFYDCMVRLPMVVWDPTGKLPRGRCDNMVEAMDIFATITDLAGLDPLQSSRAYSLARPDYEPRKDVYAEGGLLLHTVDEPIPNLNLRAPHPPSQFGPGAMLRTHDWKLCLHSCDCGELYDMKNDPHECNNLYYDEKYASIVAEMTLRLSQRMMCHGQAPEHLPQPVAVDVRPDGQAVWDKDYLYVMEAEGPLPMPHRPPTPH